MIRYKKLGYVELNVSDLEKSRKFYEEIVGLEFVGKRSDGAVMFRCDDEDSRSVILHQKQPAGFKSIGWMLEDGSQFELLHRRLCEANVPYEELGPSQCDLRQATRVTRTLDPHSRAALEFFTVDGPRPGKPFATTHTKIQRLGHVVWSVPQDPTALEK
jgi:2,3-dihydroxy-p-cumate/2,3-dihydroxybenzoate 3,4-dioxygenase